MKKMRLQDYLNEWGEDLPTYGSVVTKIVEKKRELSIQVMDWQNFVCDPVDFDSAPKIEPLTLTPSQLRLKVKEGWDPDAIEDLIEAKRESRKNLKGETVYQDAAFITVYATHHQFANAYLKDKPTKKDERTYSQQMHVIAWHVNEKKEREDFTLYKGKEKNDPYCISHWKKTKGRTLGVGVVEDMFQPQIWHNYGVKKIKDQLDLASMTIFQSSDGNLAARNVLNLLLDVPYAPIADQIPHRSETTLSADRLQKSKIERRQNSRESRSLDVSTAAMLCSADTRVPGRLCVKRCGPSRRRLRNASAALNNFVRQSKKTFSTPSENSRHRRSITPNMRRVTIPQNAWR